MITNEQIETLEHLARYATAHDHETAALRAAIDTLEALPATRDGVRVVPGMTLYWNHPAGFVSSLTASKNLGERWVGHARHSRGDDYESCGLNDCYSTRAAAEAAAERAAKEAKP